MKDFFKFTLATVTGIVLSGIVLFIIGVVTLVGIISSSDTETVVKKNSVMMLDLKGTLVERTQESLEGLLVNLPVKQPIHTDWTIYWLQSRKLKKMIT